MGNDLILEMRLDVHRWAAVKRQAIPVLVPCSIRPAPIGCATMDQDVTSFTASSGAAHLSMACRAAVGKVRNMGTS